MWKSWHIAFVQDCNLRCTYCSTNFGKYDSHSNYIHGSISENLISFIYKSVPENSTISLSFTGGETFLHYNEFITFITQLQKKLSVKNITLNISVITNGILLNEKKLDECAKLRISLNFSIDGPQEIHNSCRKDINNNKSYEKAYQNWKYYKSIQKEYKNISCVQQSVISDKSDLCKVHNYWLENNENFYDAIIQEKNRHNLNDSNEKWALRRENYLKDFEQIALSIAKETNLPHFLSNYKGPGVLYHIWTNIFLNKKFPKCKPAEKIIAVDSYGNIYPCEGFIGVDNWIIGNISDGIDKTLYDKFISEINRKEMNCVNCDYNAHCSGGCYAAEPEKGISLNKWKGCEFSKKIIDIANKSYKVLEENTKHESSC